MQKFFKTHKMVRGTVADPSAFRSLCGRSSFRVMDVESLQVGANVSAGDDVDCKFCLALLRNRNVASGSEAA